MGSSLLTGRILGGRGLYHLRLANIPLATAAEGRNRKTCTPTQSPPQRNKTDPNEGERNQGARVGGGGGGEGNGGPDGVKHVSTQMPCKTSYVRHARAIHMSHTRAVQTPYTHYVPRHTRATHVPSTCRTPSRPMTEESAWHKALKTP